MNTQFVIRGFVSVLVPLNELWILELMLLSQVDVLILH